MITRHTARRHRRGYSLIETVVVVGAVTIVLSLCGLILHGMLRLDRAGRGQFDDSATIGRLSRQFREDVHAAATVETPVSKNVPRMLTLKRDNLAIEYRAEGPWLTRTERGDDGKARNREGYRVDRIGPVKFVVKRPLVNLTLDRMPEKTVGFPHPAIRIDAELGKDALLGQPVEAKP